MNYSLILFINALTVAYATLAILRRRRRQRMLHRPRALYLIERPEVDYVKTFQLVRGDEYERPAPTAMPGPGERRSS